MNDEHLKRITDEMQQVEYLQQFVLESMWTAANSTETKYLVEYYHHFYALMEKQHILWTRMTLMNNPAYAGILLAIEMVCDALGKPPSMSVAAFHSVTRNEVKATLSELTGEDLDDYDGIDVDFKWS